MYSKINYFHQQEMSHKWDQFSKVDSLRFANKRNFNMLKHEGFYFYIKRNKFNLNDTVRWKMNIINIIMRMKCDKMDLSSKQIMAPITFIEWTFVLKTKVSFLILVICLSPSTMAFVIVTSPIKHSQGIVSEKFENLILIWASVWSADKVYPYLP